MREVIRVKFSKLIVTESKAEYEGSITIDKSLCDLAGLREYDVVEVNNFNGNRDRTYILFAPEESGEVCINGALSVRHNVGDIVHVLAFEIIDSNWDARPKIIKTKFENGINRL